MKHFLVFLSIFLSVSAFAEQHTYFKFGSGLDGAFGSSKLGAFGYQEEIFGPLHSQIEGGMFTRDGGYALFGAYSIGISVLTSGGIYAKVFTGPALLSGTDSRLSSLLEFNNDLELGLRDLSGVELGLVYKHMSNAGLWEPNPGRNWLMLKVSIPF